MAKKLTRRALLRSSVLLGSGLVFGLPGQHSSKSQAASDGRRPAQDPRQSVELTGSIRRIHDPAIIKGEDAYYVFGTGSGIPVRRSLDMLDWEIPFPPKVLANVPAWASEKIPGQNDMWAPDISYFNGKYHLYYALSTFGSNRSVIGLATNPTLVFGADGFKWTEEGLVIESNLTDNYNCIDPNVVLDEDGVPWLAFGSFWSGIKMHRLDLDTGKLSAEDDTLYALARRSVNSGSVEAPFIIRKDDWYYLFVSFDFCCRGVESTYHVMVGRSTSVTGPYVDRDGVDMLAGGGTQVTFPTERWRGPGHNSILQENGVDYIVYHAYDADNQGIPTMRIDQLEWDADGWPYIP